MTAVIVIAVAALVLAAASAYFVVASRRRSGPELEPPARPTPRTGTATIEPEVAEPPVLEPEVLEPDITVVPEVEVPTRALVPRAPGQGPQRLLRLRRQIVARSKIDEETWDDLEEALIRADVGVGPATELLESVRARVKAEGLESGAQLVDAVKDEMKARLAVDDRGAVPRRRARRTCGCSSASTASGKTTTIGKVAQA